MKNKRVKNHDVSDSFYASVHYWLKVKYGPASKCTNKKCTGKSKNYQWAKKPNKKYDYKKSNFMELCRSCHAKMDVTEKTRKRMSELNYRTHQTHCKNGHELAGTNLVINNRGHRECKICKRARWRAYNERREVKHNVIPPHLKKSRNKLQSLKQTKG